MSSLFHGARQYVVARMAVDLLNEYDIVLVGVQ